MRRIFSLVLVWFALAGSAAQAQTSNGSVIIGDGIVSPNTYGGALPDVHASWCADTQNGSPCIPTVSLDVFDSRKVRRLGTIYGWGKDFVATASGTIQFKEFVLFDSSDGQLYMLSQDGGHPGGAFADPSLVIPKRGELVLLGGAEGLVVGGTGKYRAATGPYSSRFKLETVGGFFVYYDELFFRFREVEIK